jgi:hypothetical protein
MSMMCQIKNNKVINIIVPGDMEWIASLAAQGITHEPYDQTIHPWGPNAPYDIEIGIGWKDRLKEKLGYCIFCGDGMIIDTKSETSDSI